MMRESKENDSGFTNRFFGTATLVTLLYVQTEEQIPLTVGILISDTDDRR